MIASGTIVSSGPLPDPHTLANYDTTVPGAAERIITMAENQTAHRLETEKKLVDANIRDSLLGIIFAFLLGISTVIGGVLVALYSHAGAGTLLSGIGITGLAGIFIYGTRAAKK